MAERNVATVDLTALKNNALTLKKRAGSKLFAVVKANAYGHGAERVANALHTVADGFCVALTEEGISLRYAGVSLPVLVLSPPLTEEEAAEGIRKDLCWTVEGFPALRRILRAAEGLNEPARVHLKVETGMHRLGIQPSDLAATFEHASKHPLCRVEGIFTHFADSGDEEFTAAQYGRLVSAAAPIKGRTPHLLLHAGATGALRYGTRFSLDAVRVGLGLYGYGAEGVTPVLSVTAPVLRRGRVAAGERLGYGKPVTRSEDFSLVRFGYADGALRSGGGISPCCMDAAYLPYSPADRVEILGKTRTAEEISKAEGTIPYEVLCRYTARAEFSYLP